MHKSMEINSVISNRTHWKHDKQLLGDSILLIIQDAGVMQKLHTDNAPEMVGRKTPFFARARKEGIYLTTIEPLRPDENYGEILVKKAKLASGKLMVRKNVPLRLWCYSLDYACKLSSLCSRPCTATRAEADMK